MANPSSLKLSSSSTTKKESLTRWYIDTRKLSDTTTCLPLIETLQPNDQETVDKFVRVVDKHMSLASYLLKYYFIHRTCQVPWREITISRTPAPHKRPCYIPPQYPSPRASPECIVVKNSNGSAAPLTTSASLQARNIPHIEFNVSHQASFTTLAGCQIPDNVVSGSSAAATRVLTTVNPGASPNSAIPQVGIDVTCTNETSRSRRSTQPTTDAALGEFLSIFSDVFSLREVFAIRFANLVHPDTGREITFESKEEEIAARMRLFYAYWALKEAYVKMTGEALLASWLKQLEFTNVIAPDPIPSSTSMHDSNTTRWGQPYKGIQAWLHGRRVTDVRLELVAYEEKFLIATAARGGGLGSHNNGSDNDSDNESNSNESGNESDNENEDYASEIAISDMWLLFQEIDIERDMTACAKGFCRCLQA